MTRRTGFYDLIFHLSYHCTVFRPHCPNLSVVYFESRIVASKVKLIETRRAFAAASAYFVLCSRLSYWYRRRQVTIRIQLAVVL